MPLYCLFKKKKIAANTAENVTLAAVWFATQIAPDIKIMNVK